ncbi:MAG: EAL domain-containing protein [Gammaproteobacteria bacterium]|nr:EAL domain-containing protein [Gammaproteobacteria bacterium]
MNSKLRPENTINLLILDESPNETEAYISALRNTGMAVHYNRLDREDRLIEALDSDELDIFICTYGAANITPSHAMSICNSRRPGTPVIIIYPEELDPEPLLDAMRSGTRDVVSKGDIDHLQLVVAREYTDLQTRRELEQIKNRLHESEQRCNALVENSRDAIAYVHEGMYIHANKGYLDMFGYVEMDDLEGMPIMDMVAPQDHQSFKEFLRSLDSTIKTTTLESNCQSSDGKIFKAQLEFSPASIDEEPCTQIIIRDQSLDTELEEKIQLLATQDTQTKLFNRRYLMDKLSHVTSDKEIAHSNYSLHYIQIDNFQKIRSAFGVISSDTLIKETANILKEAVDQHDLLSRFGDHTFVILSKKSKQLEAEPLAEHIRSLIESHTFQLKDDSIQPTCSIGISYLTPKNQHSQELINQAYNACEAARGEGGNLFFSYDDEEMQQRYGNGTEEPGSTNNQTPQNPYTENDASKIGQLVEQALANDGFRLVYQPIVSLQGDTREHYAVLTRLLDENNTEIAPDGFMDHARHLGLMSKIDRWVVKHSLAELAKQRSEGHKTKFFIHISKSGIEDESMLLWICDCLRELNAKGAWVIFQFREADIRAHIQSAKKLIEGLKKIRCQIAIDRFGLTTNNELLLKHMPINYIKLDQSLTNGLCQSQEKQDQLGELNRSVQSFNIKSIAMGVEDANSLAVLWTVGINYIQGYFMQRPSESITYDSNVV